MKAMVFAAGRGERLRPLTENLPKALISVAGRPMIEYPLLLLRHYGITEVIINLHYLGDEIREYLQDGRRLGLRIAYSEEKELLDTGGGLLQARAFLEDGTFIVINSDVIIDLPLTELLKSHRGRGGIATLVLRPDPQADRYGAIEISRDLRIRRFLDYKAPQWQSAGPLTKYMFTGVQLLEPEVFHYMEPEAAGAPAKFGTTKVTYPKMLTRGESLHGFPFSGYWQDTGTPERVREAEEKLTRGEVKLHYLQSRQ
ncbi:MAG: NDP-sugar synthase [Deltaproteobacteria bacterium]|nr:NDP-sugar synthase [Deltaproteobacteria bacterium]MBI2211799.1 NDP-sugar synthase [Deltaproteobacteria bacterium]MBI2347935.1 NDP-sugar synthase [Deltaproteobacteria bacterium]MBI2540290.1 NDP-sugar synthase [Deltaproteobacteria bacterium]MBI3061093.1 NDP-sugar synthase [Deltaproteobacteria bacterium]